MSERNDAVRIAAIVTMASAVAIVALSVYALLTRALYSAVPLIGVSAVYILVAQRILHARRNQQHSDQWVVAAGALLALIECANIITEHYFTLPPPANAIIPASAMAVMILCFAWSAASVSVLPGILEAMVAAMLTAALGMAVSCALGLVLAVASIHGARTRPPDLAQTVGNATMHLVLPLVVAAAVGFVAGAVHLIGSRLNRRVLLASSVGGVLLVATGVRLLVVAASLARADRPPLVMSGMLLCFVGLAALPSIAGALRSSGSSAAV